MTIYVAMNEQHYDKYRVILVTRNINKVVNLIIKYKVNHIQIWKNDKYINECNFYSIWNDKDEIKKFIKESKHEGLYI